MAKILPGKYLAKVIDHELQEKEGGAPSVGVRFELVEPEKRTITWYGSLKEKQPGKTMGAREITVQALILLGFTGKDGSELSRFQGEGKDLKPMALDTETEFELVVEEQEYMGKKTTRVQYINMPGRDGFKRMDQEKAKVVVGGLNLAGDFAEARKNAPARPVPKAQGGSADQEIPF